MHLKNGARRCSWVFGVALWGVMAILLGSSGGNQAHAQSSQVTTAICDHQPPAIYVTQPTTGTAVSTTSISVQGTVERASSLTLRRNSSLVTTISINYTGDFTIPVSLGAGDNTLELEAQFTCNNTSHTESIQVRYEPPITPPGPQPGTGGGDGHGGGDGEGVGGGADALSGAHYEQSGAGERSRPSLPDRIKNNLRGTPADDSDGDGLSFSYAVLTRSWLALLLGAGFFVVAFLPKPYYDAFLVILSSRRRSDKENRHTTAQRRTVRIVAVLLALICLTILQM